MPLRRRNNAKLFFSKLSSPRYSKYSETLSIYHDIYILDSNFFSYIDYRFTTTLKKFWQKKVLTRNCEAINLLSLMRHYPVFKSNCNQQKMYCVKTIHTLNFGFALSDSILLTVFSCKISVLWVKFFSFYIVLKIT